MLAFLRILADYDNVSNANSRFFDDDFGFFWGILAMLVVLHLIIVTLKYFMINMCIVRNCNKVHDHMIDSLLRSPMTFFYSTPSGIFVNKFTTDMGVLDNSLVVSFIDAVEGPILIIVAIVNMIHINAYFAIPAGILGFIALLFFFYSRPAFISCKQLDLQSKGPIFHFYS